MSSEEKIALDLALVLLIIVLIWARWQRYWVDFAFLRCRW